MTTDFPSQITLQADIEVEVTISDALLDEFERRDESFLNFRVGIDIPIYPNYYNIVILNSASGEREPIITMCTGYYDPEIEELKSGATPVVRLDRNLLDLPDGLLDRLTAASPNSIEGGDDQGTEIVDVTGSQV